MKNMENTSGLGESHVCTRQVRSILAVDSVWLSVDFLGESIRGRRDQGGVKQTFTHPEGKKEKRRLKE